jgi:hypothetical protein
MGIQKLSKWRNRAIKIGLIAIALYFLKEKSDQLNWAAIDIHYQKASWQFGMIFFLSLGLINILLDAKAWQIIQSFVRKISLKEALWSNIKSYGLAFVSPANSGEVVGRYLAQEEAHRKLSTYLVFWNHAPKLAGKIVLSGVILLLWFASSEQWQAFAGLLLLLGLIALLYLNLQRVLVYLMNWGVFKKLQGFYLRERPFVAEKIQLMLINSLRFGIYSFQLGLAVFLLGGDLPSLEVWLAIPLFYLIAALIPTFAGLDFLIKGTLAIYFFQDISSQNFNIAIATALVWLVNLAIPSVLGLIGMRSSEFEKIKLKRAKSDNQYEPEG